MLVGVAPQTRHFWTKCPEVMAASPLIPAGGRDPQQMVDVRLDGQSLPHIPLGRVILGIEGLFLRKGLKRAGFQGPNYPYSSSKCYALKSKTGAGHRKIPAPPNRACKALKQAAFLGLKANKTASIFAYTPLQDASILGIAYSTPRPFPIMEKGAALEDISPAAPWYIARPGLPVKGKPPQAAALSRP